ncbi:P1 family peptidase [uncultured Brevundimonas sp.]|uniref:P1 family peptidase n=1 Tax=uncultured Brevundimonas sp. TaxID=213418 RepID=UPI0030ECD2A6|tara:strand:+ start:67747 stop:68874 length:1128 start_codon:yes stop_codon:yes gene_type:complete
MNRRTLLGSMGLMGGLAAAGTASARSSSSLHPDGGRSGPMNLITDVPGLKVGQAHSVEVRTGVTVILADTPATAAVDVRGGGPASRETDVLKPENLVQQVDAIVLSGGSVYGLGAGDGVTAWLGARGRGYGMGGAPGVPLSPIVPTVCLYDLANGGSKDWGMTPPYRDLAVTAAEAAADRFELGTAGAGYGAGAGSLKGGIGSASTVMTAGYTVGAVVAVNSVGSVVAPGGRTFWAAPYEIGDEFGGLGPAGLRAAVEDWGLAKVAARPRENTTIACIATDVALTRVECQRVAIMAQDGMARAIRPSHAPFDGDIVFVVSTEKQTLPEGAMRQLEVTRIGAVAADTLARAIARGVYHATPWPGTTGGTWRDLRGH